MNQLLSASKQDELRLVEWLLSKNRKATVKDSSEWFKCSEKRILTLVGRLNRGFKERNIEAVIECVEARLNLKLAPRFHIKQVYTYCFESSGNFLMLRHFLLTRTVNVSFLMNDLFFSRSTVFRKLRELTSLLDQYKLTLTTRPLQIQGDDYHYIMFYSSLFWAVYGGQQWPFDEMVSREKICHLYNQLDSREVSAEREPLLFQLAVWYIRIKQRNPSTMINSVSFAYEENFGNVDYQNVRELMALLKHEFRTHYQDKLEADTWLVNDTKLFLLHVYMQPCRNMPHHFFEMKQRYFTEVTNDLNERSHEIVSQFKQFFSCQYLCEEEDIIKAVYDVLAVMYVNYEKKIWLDQEAVSLPIMREYPLFSQKFRQFFNQCVTVKEEKLTKEIKLRLEEILKSLFYHTIDLREFDIVIRISNKVEYSPCLERNLRYYLEDHCACNFKIDEVSSPDIVIMTKSYFKMPVLEENVVYVSYPMEKRDYDHIKNSILDAYETKTADIMTDPYE